MINMQLCVFGPCMCQSIVFYPKWYPLSIHPLSIARILLWVVGGAEADSSWWARGRVHPREVTGPSKGHIQRQTTIHILIHTDRQFGVSSKPPNLILDCGRKLECEYIFDNPHTLHLDTIRRTEPVSFHTYSLLSENPSRHRKNMQSPHRETPVNNSITCLHVE